jgi:hypothetical protein
VERKLTIAANIAIIIAVIAILASLARNDSIARSRSTSSTGQLPRPSALVGHTFPVQQSWSPYNKTIVLALAVGCHFCSASAPFYKDLAGYASTHHINLVALLPQGLEESRAYLKELGLTIPTVQQVNFMDIKVVGTPTLFLVDSQGVVQKVWEGQLKETEQKKVLSALG